MRDIEYGIPMLEQQRETVQIVNDTNIVMSYIFIKNNNEYDWSVNLQSQGEGMASPNSFSNNGGKFQGKSYPLLILRPKEWIVLNIPTSGRSGYPSVPGGDQEAFTIWPRGLCDESGNNCMSGSNPTSYVGSYITSKDWNQVWPIEGGYTICQGNPIDGCPSGTTKIEGGKEMVCDVSVVDGYNFGVKMELTSSKSIPGNEINTPYSVTLDSDDCKGGIRNYQDGLLIGCSNTFKDGVWKRKPEGSWYSPNPPQVIDMWSNSDGGSGFCNVLGSADPIWQSMCYAPVKDYCEIVHSKTLNPSAFSGNFTPYCFSHDDKNSSPHWNADYKMKLTFYNGIVGKYFDSSGCNWSNNRNSCFNNNIQNTIEPTNTNTCPAIDCPIGCMKGQICPDGKLCPPYGKNCLHGCCP